jgi:hypothetical protein
VIEEELKEFEDVDEDNNDNDNVEALELYT